MKSKVMRRRGERKAGAWGWAASLLIALLVSSCNSGGSGTQPANDDQAADEAEVSDSKRLNRAVRSGDIDEVRREFAEIGKDINSIYDEGAMSPLATAVMLEEIEIVEFFLSEGADVNGPSRTPPIVNAAFKDNIVLVTLLLERGADPNSKMEVYGATALRMTTSTVVARLLVDAGADIDAQADDGYTALHVAATGWDLPMVSFLVSEGANIDAQANDGRTALHVAAGLLDLPIVSFLVSAGANIEVMDVYGDSALDYAAKAVASNEDKLEAQESIIELLSS